MQMYAEMPLAIETEFTYLCTILTLICFSDVFLGNLRHNGLRFYYVLIVFFL